MHFIFLDITNNGDFFNIDSILLVWRDGTDVHIFDCDPATITGEEKKNGWYNIILSKLGIEDVNISIYWNPNVTSKRNCWK